MHGSFSSGDFVSTTAGDSSYQAQITGLIATGENIEAELFANHVGREFNKKLDSFNLSHLIQDDFSSGFRPLSNTGFFAEP